MSLNNPILKDAKEILKSLEDLEIIFSHDEVNLVLMLMGIKTITEIEIVVEKDKKSQRKLIEGSFKKLNLSFFSKDEIYNKDRSLKYATLYVGKNEKDVEKFSEISSRDGIESEVARGEMLGIPDSAISGWVDKKLKDEKTLPREIVNDDAFKFLDFKLSQKDWRREFDLLKERVKVIRENFPELYNNILKNDIIS